MNPGDQKKNPGNSGEVGKSKRPGDKTDESFTPPHGDPEKAHLANEPALRKERHSRGILGGELDEGGVQFEPESPHSKPHGTTEDQIKEMESEGPGPAEGRTDNKAGG